MSGNLDRRLHDSCRSAVDIGRPKPYPVFMTTTNKTMSNDEAAKAIAKVTAKLNREGHSELSMEIIKLAAKYLAK